MIQGIETIDYIGHHKDKVVEFTNKINTIIKNRLGNNDKIEEFIKEANKRALSHDDDKLYKYRTLDLYINRDELETEEEKLEYKKSHKLSANHHVDYFVDKHLQMNLNDIYEMMADVYSSTLLRHKKSFDELLEEQNTGKFSDEYLYMILNTYSLINYNFRQDTRKKFPNNRSTYDFIDLLRSTLLQGNKMKPFIKIK